MLEEFLFTAAVLATLGVPAGGIVGALLKRWPARSVLSSAVRGSAIGVALFFVVAFAASLTVILLLGVSKQVNVTEYLWPLDPDAQELFLNAILYLGIFGVLVGITVGSVVGLWPGKSAWSNFVRGGAAGTFALVAGFELAFGLGAAVDTFFQNLKEPVVAQRQESVTGSVVHSDETGQGQQRKRGTKFERTKPHLNIGTLGHIGHGKTIVAAAITKVLAETGQATFKSVNEIKQTPEEKERGISVATAILEYETDQRHYAHFDSPRRSDYIKNLITGAVRIDGAILVVSALIGPTEQTREHIRLARQVGVPAIIVYLDNVDRIGDPGALNAVELEVRQILSRHGYPGDELKVIRGSALRALEGDRSAIARGSILKLLDALDTYIAMPPYPRDLPFLMPIEDVFSISGRGTVVTGRVERGVVRIGDDIEIVGLAETRKTTVEGIEMFRRVLEQAEAGDNVGILLRRTKRDELERGQVLAAPGSITAHTEFKAEAYFLTQQEGGRHTPFFSDYRPQFYFRTTDVTGTVDLPDNTEMVMPGDNVSIQVNLIAPMAIDEGIRFAIREGGRTVGAGVVTQVID